MTTPAKPYDSQEIWFLTGSQSLYGDDTLAQVAHQSRQIAEQLNAATEIPLRIVWKPVLTGAGSIRRLCRQATASDNCVGVIMWMHTFSPAKMWIAGLSALDRPVLHLHTQYNLSLPWSSIDMHFMNFNQTAHGDREFGHIEARIGDNRKVVAGHATDPRVVRRVAAWSRAAVGRHAARSLRLACFGDNTRDVAVTEGDKVEAQMRFGFSMNTYGGKREDPVRLVFDAAPGPALVVGISDLGDRFRLTANAVDVVAPGQPPPRLPVARAVWKPRPSLAESAEGWLLAGAPHHTVLSSAIDIETLTDFAAMTGVELLTIDENTTAGQLAKEMRWNAAYHRLAQAL
jgi:L-arabinose isomerase